MKRPTCIEIANNFDLWGEYFDPHATTTQEGFDGGSAEERLALLHEYYPIDDCNCGWAEHNGGVK